MTFETQYVIGIVHLCNTSVAKNSKRNRNVTMAFTKDNHALDR